VGTVDSESCSELEEGGGGDGMPFDNSYSDNFGLGSEATEGAEVRELESLLLHDQHGFLHGENFERLGLHLYCKA
jgi:hypothetical protein